MHMRACSRMKRQRSIGQRYASGHAPSRGGTGHDDRREQTRPAHLDAACESYPLLVGILIAVAQLSLFAIPHGGLRMRADLPSLLLFVAVLIISVVAHELIHGLTWRTVAGKATAMITYGFQWRTLTPYAHVRGLIEVNAYRIGRADARAGTGRHPLPAESDARPDRSAARSNSARCRIGSALHL